MTTVSATQLKNSIGKYLDIALIEGEVRIVRYGRVIAKLVAVNENSANNTQ